MEAQSTKVVITLEPPEPVPVVPPSDAMQIVKLDADRAKTLDGKVQEFVAALWTIDARDEAFQAKMAAVHNLGAAETREAAAVSNRMLERPVKAMGDGIFDGKSPISKSLIDLRNTVEDLDPSRQGDLFSPRKLLGIIPMGNRIRDYFMKYQSSQTHIDGILSSLYRGQDELRKDNAALEQEKQNLWTLMQRLKEYAHMGKGIDAALERRLGELDVSDPMKAKLVREEMLFYVRQKVQDLLTQLAVSIQGYLAVEMIRKNNLELIKGVDRAATTTVSALRTAVIVAQALANQKLVLDQISALNTVTGNVIEATSAMLKSQTADIHAQAANSTIDLAKLQTAFQNVYAAMDMVSDYKGKALATMKLTVDSLTTEVDKAKNYIDRVRSEEAQKAVGSVAKATAELTL